MALLSPRPCCGEFGQVVEDLLADPAHAQRGIQQDQRPEAAVFGRWRSLAVGLSDRRQRQKCHQRRQGVVDADSRLAAEMMIDRLQYARVVSNKRGDPVVLQRAGRVPAVVPDVVDDEIEVIQQQGPEREVEIDRESVAVAQDKPGTRGISMPPHDGYAAVVKTDFAGRQRSRNPLALGGCPACLQMRLRRRGKSRHFLTRRRSGTLPG